MKNDIRNLVNYHASSRKSESLHWLLLSKIYKDLDEKVQKNYISWHWRVTQSLKKKWLLVPWGLTNLVNFNGSSCKSENLHFHVLLLSIAYKVSAKKYRRIISHETEEWSILWRKTDFLFEKWHEKFGEL